MGARTQRGGCGWSRVSQESGLGEEVLEKKRPEHFRRASQAVLRTLAFILSELIHSSLHYPVSQPHLPFISCQGYFSKDFFQYRFMIFKFFENCLQSSGKLHFMINKLDIVDIFN